MSAIGLLALRLGIARPLPRRLDETSLRAFSTAFLAAAAVGLVAIPVYLDLATAQFALRSPLDVAALLPLDDASSFGRGYLILELVFALFAAAGAVALWVDRSEKPRRTVAALLSSGGAAIAAAGVLLVPGAAGHAAQTAPRAASLLLDWCHLAAGSVWVGGLFGLLVLWRSLPAPRRVAGLAVTVPRFSNTALAAVLVLLGSGIGSTVVHMPTLPALWQTSYDKTILVKAGLLAAAMLLASVNLARTKPRLAAARRWADAGPPPASLLRRLAGGELALVWSAVVAAAVLSSLAPPPPALAEEGGALARVGPGPVHARVVADGYVLQVGVSSNRAAVAERLLRAPDEERRPGQRRGGHAHVRHARHADGHPGVPPRRDRAEAVRAAGRPGARDGRALGPLLPGGAAARDAVHRARRRPGLRMTPPSAPLSARYLLRMRLVTSAH